MSAPLDRFFAVTETSLYSVSAERDDHGWPIVEKIAMREGTVSQTPIGARLDEGRLVGVTPFTIVLYTDVPTAEPNQHSASVSVLKKHARPRPPEKASLNSWGGKTSSIIALFFNEDEARDCLTAENVRTLDSRWQKETTDVLRAIGTDHPVFIVGQSGSFAFPKTFLQSE